MNKLQSITAACRQFIRKGLAWVRAARPAATAQGEAARLVKHDLLGFMSR